MAAAITPIPRESLAVLDFEVPELEKIGGPDELEGRSLGKYRVERRLGMGAWGVAYLASHEITKKPFAIKVLAENLARSNVQARRFVREAKLTAPLQHENIRQIFDVDNVGGYYYMVMEYVIGAGLHALVYRNKLVQPDVAARIVGQVSMGLAYALARGIVHADVRPRNILVGTDGVVKMTDFGLCVNVYESPERVVNDPIVRTPEFMSPEHFANWELDQRSDIYGLGCTFYYMLTGRTPFLASDPHTLMYRQKTEDPPNPREFNPRLPLSICSIVLKMLEWDPFDRYQQYEELIADLQTFLDQTKM